MDTHAVVARFEAERQALAMMDHTHIARVLDGGATDSGRPYFVMELVKGVPITQYCDKNQLSTDERLRLFTDVCQAVQHAHQKGIIHRDLKPSNVLVTLADGKPIVKVIDFGVAKATNQQLTEKTLFTAYGQMVGTPQYMSPEQAEMSCLDVDTRSDVYSLACCCTNCSPARRRWSRATPHGRLCGDATAHPRGGTAQTEHPAEHVRRQADHHRQAPQRLPEKLKHQVAGDLDWIVMKAMEKDRNRRYETPNDLAADVANYLDSEPVAARPPTLTYRASKYFRRHRVAISRGGAPRCDSCRRADRHLVAGENRRYREEKSGRATWDRERQHDAASSDGGPTRSPVGSPYGRHRRRFGGLEAHAAGPVRSRAGRYK